MLFDEVEKAHPDVFNTLLQVLDDGRLTDNKGRTVNFKNTIIIMTSNLGSQLIQNEFSKIRGFENDERKVAEVTENAKNAVLELLKKTIRPEFLNRIDETIMFQPLKKNEIRRIVELQVKGVANMLKDNGIELRLTDSAIDFLADVGFDPEFGARPVKRAIQHLLLNDLSKQILAGTVNREKPIVVDYQNEKLVFEN